MNAYSAMRKYQQVGVQAQLVEASPHRLIQMLFEGALDRISQATGAMRRGQVAEKAQLIGKSINIVSGLQQALDKEKGGEYAERLDSLYVYINAQLMQANLNNDVNKLSEVSGLLRQVKEGWDGIAPQS
ncbi:flagellar protein FliS [Pseudomonas flavescens]|uniref:Flagellar secretion chaperone FliS n=1 Tax=Phytopseudomonas flavescens TaxID=29435 RepID=A0A1G8J9E4_9GAMM|nr:flagellar export chaperone FliS [Pseudomonas flavescens]SDI27855.1 flagellar protein FliS [Pseudomonas flavescens]